jgi:hypothetical protein
MFVGVMMKSRVRGTVTVARLRAANLTLLLVDWSVDYG